MFKKPLLKIQLCGVGPKGSSTSFTNNYKVMDISGQTIVLALSGIAKPITALNSANSTLESKGGTYRGTIEFIKATGLIKKMEIMREQRSTFLINNCSQV